MTYYQPVGLDDVDLRDDQDAFTSSSSSSTLWTISVLCGQKTTALQLPRNATVLDLKSAFTAAEAMESELQRYFFKGSTLRPDTQKLHTFGIEDGCVLHLFPLKASQVPSITGTARLGAQDSSPRRDSSSDDRSGSNNRSTTSAAVEGVNAHGEGYQALDTSSSGWSSSRLQQMTQRRLELGHPSSLFDEEVQETSKSVRMWSMILLFVSASNLFNDAFYVLVTGSFGDSFLPSLERIVEIGLGIWGLKVSRLGLGCSTTHSLAEIRSYVRKLLILGFLSVLNWGLWAAAEIVRVQEIYKEQQQEDQNSGDGGSPGGGTPGGGGGGDGGAGSGTDARTNIARLTPQRIRGIGIEVAVICAVGIGCWVVCMYRYESPFFSFLFLFFAVCCWEFGVCSSKASCVSHFIFYCLASIPLFVFSGRKQRGREREREKERERERDLHVSTP
jgi:hypothetical protein